MSNINKNTLVIFLFTFTLCSMLSVFSFDLHHDGIILGGVETLKNNEDLYTHYFTIYGYGTYFISYILSKIFSFDIYIYRLSISFIYGLNASLLFVISMKIILILMKHCLLITKFLY